MRSLAAVFFAGILIGLVIVELQKAGLFFALILGYLVGLAIAKLVIWASGGYRGKETARIALGGAIWSYLTPYLYVYGFSFGVVAQSLTESPFVLLGAALAAYIAYNRAS